MNKWQKVYCEEYFDGKMPRSKQGKVDMELLSSIKNEVIIYMPNGDKIYTVTENECDIPNGKISVDVLVSNMKLWMSRKIKITTR